MTASVNSFLPELNSEQRQELLRHYKEIFDTYNDDFECTWLFGKYDKNRRVTRPFILMPYDGKNKIHDVTNYILNLCIYTKSFCLNFDKNTIAEHLYVSTKTVNRVLKLLASRDLINISPDHPSCITINFDAMYINYGGRVFCPPCCCHPLPKKTVRSFIEDLLIPNSPAGEIVHV